MKIRNILTIPLVSLFIGCGTLSEDNTLDIDNINAVQEGLAVPVSVNNADSLPAEIRKNRVSKYGDKGYTDEN